MKFKCLCLALFWCFHLSALADLVHRYRFNGAPGTTVVVDSVRGQNGDIRGPASFDGEGKLDLGGTGYVHLPNGLISKLTNATFETWFTWNGNVGYPRIFDFGMASNTEDNAGVFGPGQNILFCIAAGEGAFLMQTDTFAGVVYQGTWGLTEGSQRPQTAVEYHLVVTYDWSNNVSRIYVNGIAAGVSTALMPLFSLVDINNWLGRSNWGDGDPLINGVFNEFRIYNHVLNPMEILSNYRAGPEFDQAPGLVAGLESVNFKIQPIMRENDFQEILLLGATSSQPAIDLTHRTSTVFTSNDNSIVGVGAKGILVARKVGTATITATHGSLQASKTVTVKPVRTSHRFSFNEAVGETASQNKNLGGEAKLMNGASFSGSGLARLNQINDFIDLPNGLISGHTNTTIEIWVTWIGNPGDGYRRLFDFGVSAAGEDQRNSATSDFLFTPTTPVDGNKTVMSFFSRAGRPGFLPTMAFFQGNTQFPANAETHLVVTWDYSAGNVSIYTNAVLAASGFIGGHLNRVQDLNCWLGRSQWVEPNFQGSYNEFRVYSGALSPAAIQQSYLDGPNHDGALDSISLILEDRLLAVGESPSIQLLAHYIKKTVDVSKSGGTYASSAPTVLSVDASGRLTAMSSGTAEITGQFSGLQDKITVTVFQPKPLTLKHRYDFAEGPGEKTLHDRVGTADGTVVGDETEIDFTGDGALNFFGVDGFVSLPPNLLSPLVSVSVEAWYTANIPNSDRLTLFDFGDFDSVAKTGTSYFSFMTSDGEGSMRFTASTNREAGEIIVKAPPAINPLAHVVIVYDFYQEILKCYVDGGVIGEAKPLFPLQSFNDLQNYIGKSRLGGIGFLSGSVIEFRIYEGVMSDEIVSSHFQLGPDSLSEAGPVIKQIRRKTGNITRLIIETKKPGDSLFVQAADSLGESWTNLSNLEFVSEGENLRSVEFTDGAVRKFYRVGVTPAP